MIEVKKEQGIWRVVEDSPYARRITMNTDCRISGPAAGHDRLKTNADPTGTKVFGTINNCAGGKTPWGTVLMAEENFHGYFGGGSPHHARSRQLQALRHLRQGALLVAQATTASTSARSRTSRTGSAGWSSTIPTTPARCR